MSEPLASAVPPCELLLPGWLNSEPDHWQSRWQTLRPGIGRVDFGSWERPDRSGWLAALGAAVQACPGAPLLIGHSLGCLAAAAWIARHGPQRAAAVMLVAPPDPERADSPEPIRCFAPVAPVPLNVPGLVVSSSDDPYAELNVVRGWAESWGLEHICIGARGHINAGSGLGDWPQGLALLEHLRRRC